MGEPGRLVHVATRGVLRLKLVAVYPETQWAEGKRLWEARNAGPNAGN